MKKYILFVAVLSLVFVSGILTFHSSAQIEDPGVSSASSLVSTTIVISQFQAGGGVADDEFIELHNVGSAPVDLNGHVVVYRSAAGVTDVGPFASWSASTIVQPGQFYLIATTSYDGAATPNLTWSPSIGSMAAGAGGLAIRNGAPNTGMIVDAVGWGTATNLFFEGTRTVAPGNNNSDARNLNGCQDTDNNLNDFFNLVPSVPRNTASALVSCVTDPTQLFAAISASPATVSPGSNTLLAVTVVPATTPASTGITVTGNLSTIGGSASQTFFDNGTNGDATPGDNVFSFLATIPVGTAGGVRTVTAVAADAQLRTVNLNQSININTPLPNEDPLLFGNPSGATTDVANENNYLMVKPQYTLSYSRSRNIPNWTSWRLDSSWIGGTPRQDDFRPDTTLPAGWYQVVPADYSEPVYDRGHMCPSGDRTNSVPNNSATFLMTNMVPQIPANNQGPWEDFESYCRVLASQGNEIYITSGSQGNIGTIGSTAQNRVVVPAFTWKVVLVLPNGADDLSRVNRATRAFGIIIQNQPPLNQNDPWRPYRVTVDAVENLTGYNFFSNIPKNTQELIEKKRDRL